MQDNTEDIQSLLSWEYDNKPQYQRGKSWYVGMAIAATLLLLYAIISANFLFALIILMVALIVYLGIITGPDRRVCSITENGIHCGKTFHPYRELDRFWFAYDPPLVKKLYIVPRSRLDPAIVVELEQQNPLSVRQVLSQFMAEDLERAEEPLGDRISRLLKL